MSIKQIGELPELSTIPVGSKGVVLDNHNDANVVPVESVAEGICGTEVEQLSTRNKTISGGINELYAFATKEFWVGTQAEYNEIETKENIPYLITDAPVMLWVGTQEDYEELSEYSQNTLYVIVG
jgi:hypothetical protein